jgi:WD40 repeat protein
MKMNVTFISFQLFFLNSSKKIQHYKSSTTQLHIHQHTMETTDAPQIIEHIHESVTFTPYETRWVPCSAKLAILGIYPKGTGVIKICELQKGKLKTVVEKENKVGFKCGTFGASSLDNRAIATGDFDGNVQVWDLERMDVPTFSVKGHDKIINCIDGCGGLSIGNGAPELATGSRDGVVRVWDPRVQEPVVSLEPEEGSDGARDCWTVCFGNSYNDDERVVCAGYDNGDVKMFDLRTNSIRWETNVGNGVTGLEFDRKDIEMNKLCVTTLESKFRIYDVRTQHPDDGFAFMREKAHKATIWHCKHLPQNRDLFMTCGGNGGLNIYKYSYPSQRSIKDANGVMKGQPGSVELLNSKVISTQPIVSFDWSPDKEGLACMACLDQTVRVNIVTKLHLY